MLIVRKPEIFSEERFFRFMGRRRIGRGTTRGHTGGSGHEVRIPEAKGEWGGRRHYRSPGLRRPTPERGSGLIDGWRLMVVEFLMGGSAKLASVVCRFAHTHLCISTKKPRNSPDVLALVCNGVIDHSTSLPSSSRPISQHHPHEPLPAFVANCSCCSFAAGGLFFVFESRCGVRGRSIAALAAGSGSVATAERPTHAARTRTGSAGGDDPPR